MALTQILDHVDQALARLPARFEDSINLRNLITALVTPIQVLEDVAWSVIQERIIANMTGIRLDQLGKIVGQERNGLSDDDYRSFLYAKIKVLKSNGLLEELYEIVRLLLLDPNANLSSVLPIAGDEPGVLIEILDQVISDQLAHLIITFLSDAVGAGKPLNLISYSQASTDSFMFGFTGVVSGGYVATDTVITVSNTAFFPPGSTAVFGDGLANEETVTVASRTATTITISPGLTNAHASGEFLTLVTSLGKGFDAGKFIRSADLDSAAPVYELTPAISASEAVDLIPVAFVGSSTGGDSITASTLTIPVVPGILPGDFIMVFSGAVDTEDTSDVSDGEGSYNFINFQGFGTNSDEIQCWSKVATGNDDDAVITYTGSTGTKFGIMVVYRGLTSSGGGSIKTSAENSSTISTGSWSAFSGIATVGFFGDRDSASALSISSGPASYTLRETHAAGTTHRLLAVYSLVLNAEAGPDDTLTWSASDVDSGRISVRTLKA